MKKRKENLAARRSLTANAGGNQPVLLTGDANGVPPVAPAPIVAGAPIVPAPVPAPAPIVAGAPIVPAPVPAPAPIVAAPPVMPAPVPAPVPAVAAAALSVAQAFVLDEGTLFEHQEELRVASQALLDNSANYTAAGALSPAAETVIAANTETMGAIKTALTRKHHERQMASNQLTAPVTPGVPQPAGPVQFAQPLVAATLDQVDASYGRILAQSASDDDLNMINSMVTDEQRLMQASITQDSGVGGGFATPPPIWMTAFIKEVDKNTVMREAVTSFTGLEPNGSVSWPRETSIPAAFGFQSNQTGATAALPDGTPVSKYDSPTFGEFNLTPAPYNGLCRVSRSTFNSNPALISQLVRMSFAKSYAATIEDVILFGIKGGQTIGLVNPHDLGLPANRAVKSGAAAAFTYKGLSKISRSVLMAVRMRSSWWLGSPAAGLISEMVDGQGRPLWAQSARSGEPDLLLGLAATEIERFTESDTISAGDTLGLFGDMESYFLAEAGAMAISFSDQYGFGSSFVHYRADGQMAGGLSQPKALSRIIAGV